MLLKHRTYVTIFSGLILTSMLYSTFACRGPKHEPIAKVNGSPIFKKDFEEEVARNLARYQKQNQQIPPAIEVRIKESILRRMIDNVMMAQQAKKLKIDLTAKEIEEKLAEHKQRFRTEEAFTEYLTRSNNTLASFKEDLKNNILRERVIEKLGGEIKVSDEEVHKYYTENSNRFMVPEQVKVSRIVTKLQPGAHAAEAKAAEQTSKKIYGLVSKKKADFGAIATKDSQGPEASRGGEIGWLSRGQMPAAFDNVAFNLKAGEISKPVKTELGYEIIYVQEKQPARQRPFDEIKENLSSSLLARLRNEKRRDIMSALKNETKVEIFIKFEEPPTPAPAAAPEAPAPEKAPAPSQGGAAPEENKAPAAKQP